ncbi:MAG: F420-0--gamma-glutamyl ligase [bacterium]|nr:F420-0--gamma-glutamyl ligase [bacterium]
MEFTDFYANEGKEVAIYADGAVYARHAIKTHFVQIGESYIDLIERYVLPIYESGDILFCSEKVIALCQGRIVTEEEVRPGLWARILCRFVRQTPAGPGMGLPRKMQFAINHCGLAKVLWAAVCAGLDGLRGVHGTFYDMLGEEIRGLDGFYGEDISEYAHIGIRIPSQPDRVCDEVWQKTGVAMVIVDANDLGTELLGKSLPLINRPDSALLRLIADNPAGQSRQCTPFILVRRRCGERPWGAPPEKVTAPAARRSGS